METNSPQPNSRKRRRQQHRRSVTSSVSSPNNVDDKSSLYNGYNAFWRNYKKASVWAKGHEVAYWRSKAVALEFENNMLRQQIKKLCINDQVPQEMEVYNITDDFGGNRSITNPMNQRNKYHSKKSRKAKNKGGGDSCEGSSLEFEITEDMKNFFEINIRHKMEQEKKNLADEKRAEEAAFAAGEEDAKLISQPLNFASRTEELKVLYGDASPMIHGMETAVQLTFRRHCERTGARLWPNIPLKL